MVPVPGALDQKPLASLTSMMSPEWETSRRMNSVLVYKALGQLGHLCHDGGAADAADGVLNRNARTVPVCRHGKARHADQLDDHPVGILQPERRLAHLFRRAQDFDVMRQRPCQPEADALGIDGECDLARLAVADAAGPAVLPDQEGDQCARIGGTVAIEQVQLRRVLIAAGLLDQPQPEKADIEVDIGLHLAGDERDVVDASAHDAPPADLLLPDIPSAGREVQPMFGSPKRKAPTSGAFRCRLGRLRPTAPWPRGGGHAAHARCSRSAAYGR